ncbi:Dabb family protein [Candidatus Parcubacteria bacterium]|nr:MAG: Dabb family protein [Candidatus Parcubacteria bacterium]
MITHIAIFRWKPGTTEEETISIMKDIRTLKGQIDGIIDIRCGKNFSKWNEGYTHAFVVMVRDRDALDAYRNHPLHRSAAEKIGAMDAGSIGIDFEDAT